MNQLPEPLTAEDLTEDTIAKMSKGELIKSVTPSFDLGAVERIEVQAFIKARAEELGENVLKNITYMISALGKEDKRNESKFNRAVARRESVIPLKYDEKGAPCVTIDNFLMVMRNDPFFDGVKYNLLLNAPEIHEGGEVRRWCDADEAESRHYIETVYNIHSEGKHFDALRILFKEREYHPIQDIVDGLEWDGENRIENFLHKWTQCDDNEYTREVSRLIFAGGIHRLYSPGCKFDDVPVLIGTAQGEGKSTIVRWLAIHDSYFSEIKTIEGKEAIEQLDGAWICEVAELLALTKAKEQEAVKSYITCQRDKYRRPYDRQTSEFPRRCIFVGTTNNEQFLKDKTGNRRFYPVTVHSSAYWLYDHEQECRDYIIQCWAEAKARYDKGAMPNYANQALREEYKAAQEDAMEDDWRVGAIEQFLDSQPAGAFVCVRQIKHQALSASKDFPQDPSPKESQEISTLMCKFPHWKKAGVHKIEEYGRQRCWQKDYSDDDMLPL